MEATATEQLTSSMRAERDAPKDAMRPSTTLSHAEKGPARRKGSGGAAASHADAHNNGWSGYRESGFDGDAYQRSLGSKIEVDQGGAQSILGMASGKDLAGRIVRGSAAVEAIATTRADAMTSSAMLISNLPLNRPDSHAGTSSYSHRYSSLSHSRRSLITILHLAIDHCHRLPYFVKMNTTRPMATMTPRGVVCPLSTEAVSC